MFTFFESLYTPSAASNLSFEATNLLLHLAALPSSDAQLTAYLDVPFSASEALRAIHASGLGSAPGMDGLPYTFWRIDPAIALANFMRGGRRLSDDYPLARCVLLFKNKGSRADPSRYRPLSLLDCDLRIIDRMAVERLQTAAQTLLRSEQTGVLRHRHSVDSALAVHLGDLFGSERVLGVYRSHYCGPGSREGIRSCTPPLAFRCSARICIPSVIHQFLPGVIPSSCCDL